MPDNRPRRERRKSTHSTYIYILSATIFLLVCIIAGAFGWCGYYAKRALPGTAIGDVAIGGLTASQATQKVTEAATTARITLTAPAVNGVPAQTRKYSYQQLGTRVDIAKSIANVYQTHKHSFFAPLNFWGEYRYPAQVESKFTQQELLRLFPQLENSFLKPINAQVNLDSDTNEFSVTPGKPGKTLNASAVQSQVAAAARGLHNATVALAVTPLEPAFGTEVATRWAKLANSAIATNVTVIVPAGTDHPRRETRASRAEISSWIVDPSLELDSLAIDTTQGTKPMPLIFAHERVENWVTKASQIGAVLPQPGRRTVTSSGKTLLVIQEPIVAAGAANVAELTDQIITQLADPASAKLGALQVKEEAGKETWEDIRITTPVSYSVWPYDAQPNELWVDVNLGKRQVTVFRGKTQVFGPVEMVPGAKDTPTLTGTFRVYLKRPLQTLRGTNPDGSPYLTPDVPWIMYYDGSYALHAAPWRNAWGFNAVGGSHGCVNLPTRIAHDLYEIVPLDTVVRVHD